jgi:hypothetical protein
MRALRGFGRPGGLVDARVIYGFYHLLDAHEACTEFLATVSAQRWHRFFGHGYKWISGRAPT